MAAGAELTMACYAEKMPRKLNATLVPAAVVAVAVVQIAGEPPWDGSLPTAVYLKVVVSFVAFMCNEQLSRSKQKKKGKKSHLGDAR